MMVAAFHIILFALVILLPIALIALLVWYYLRLRASRRR